MPTKAKLKKVMNSVLTRGIKRERCISIDLHYDVRVSDTEILQEHECTQISANKDTVF